MRRAWPDWRYPAATAAARTDPAAPVEAAWLLLLPFLFVRYRRTGVRRRGLHRYRSRTFGRRCFRWRRGAAGRPRHRIRSIGPAAFLASWHQQHALYFLRIGIRGLDQIVEIRVAQQRRKDLARWSRSQFDDRHPLAAASAGMSIFAPVRAATCVRTSAKVEPSASILSCPPA